MSHMPTPDSQAPALDLPLVGGGRFVLSEQSPEMFTSVVFYRGLHCPVCKDYLGRLEGLLDAYAEAGLSIVAVSMNNADQAAKAKAEWDLPRLPIAYDLTLEDARSWGLYVSKGINEVEAETFVEPGTFWVRPDGRLYLIDIANMPWARPDPEFLLSKVAVVKARNYPARGTFVEAA